MSLVNNITELESFGWIKQMKVKTIVCKKHFYTSYFGYCSFCKEEEKEK